MALILLALFSRIIELLGWQGYIQPLPFFGISNGLTILFMTLLDLIGFGFYYYGIKKFPAKRN